MKLVVRVATRHVETAMPEALHVAMRPRPSEPRPHRTSMLRRSAPLGLPLQVGVATLLLAGARLGLAPSIPTLVKFLQMFDVPVLCMTATLPPKRREELQKYLKSYPREEDRQYLKDLEENECCKRYVVKCTTRANAFEQAVAAVEQKALRVLWVVNTVDRCQQLASELAARLKRDVTVYHSRFKLKDRQERHRETIASFRWPAAGEPHATIAVTTQVCEMSLDLDADVLITEQAPISALVQRLGRANRHLRRPNFKATVLTYEPNKNVPYDSDDLAGVAEFLQSIDGCEVSQRQLSEGLERFAPASRAASGASRFVDGGYYATRGNLRDDDGIGCQAILDRDVDDYLTASAAERPGFVVNVPKRFAKSDVRLDPFLLVAPADRYNIKTGFRVGESGNEGG